MFYKYVIYILLMSILTFVIFGVDKKKAIRRRWRIPEVVLLGLSLMGGCFGAYLAMHFFHHKTRYARFAMGVPAMMLAHACLALYFFEKGIFHF
ncbi:MAG: DUF1294 domain-containing protein [Oscillospiraceae bacterium]|nr:DUF1294 domain-containing protein [Oscillospiraceae bacterium]